MPELLITNCRLYNYFHDVTADILIENGIIKAIGKLPHLPNYQIFDAQNHIVAPGFIDIHIQGAGGSDILDNSAEAIINISKTLAKFGITGFLATTVLKPEIGNAHLKIATELTGKDLGGARLLGIHLEGPFISLEKKGGISPRAIYPFSEKLLNQILEITNNKLSIMTLAPEIEGGLTLIKILRDHNIIASLGHSNVNYELCRLAIQTGINHVTHIFNAMPPIHHRYPGPIIAILEAENVSVQVISDGVHLHPSIVKLIYRLFGNDRIISISDGIQAIGLPEGRYFYNDKEYMIKNGTAFYSDGTLIGTGLPVSQIAKRYRQFTECSLAEAVETITINPAKLLGLTNLGKIAPGYLADLVIMDNEFNVKVTFVNGNIVYLDQSFHKSKVYS